MPSKELTFANLNDNIDSKFLESMCAKFGELVECRIYYHPRTKKHLGLAKVLFQSERAAKECQAQLNKSMKMGNRMDVLLDTQGVERSKMVETLCCANEGGVKMGGMVVAPPPPPPQPLVLSPSKLMSLDGSPLLQSKFLLHSSLYILDN
jgi:RNA recognition motif-containing protein